MKIYNKMNFGYATESDSQPENKYSGHNTMLNLVKALVYGNSTTNSIQNQINTDILKKSSRPCKIFLIYQWTKMC